MKCWKCEAIIPDNSELCLSCNTSQKRKEPNSPTGRIMRSLFDQYGNSKILLSKNFLVKELQKSDITVTEKFLGSLQNAMNIGLGILYKAQLTAGAPDNLFYERIRNFFQNTVELDNNFANEIISCFDEMIGWSERDPAKNPGKNPPKEEISDKPQNNTFSDNSGRDYDVILWDCGPSKIAIIDIIVFSTGMEMMEAFKLAENPGSVIMHGIERNDAFNICKYLRENGANVKMNRTNNLHPWDVITFGKHLQNGEEPEPIEWIVLRVENGLALVISYEGFLVAPYHKTSAFVSWEDCSLRQWLNDSFYNNTFTNEEKGRIVRHLNNNLKNPVYNTPGGNDTTDYIFLLSIEEANQLFPRKELRLLLGSARVNKILSIEEDEPAPWWLRSPGVFANSAAEVSRFGTVNERGDLVNKKNNVVRPAFWLKLTK